MKHIYELLLKLLIEHMYELSIVYLKIIDGSYMGLPTGQMYGLCMELPIEHAYGPWMELTSEHMYGPCMELTSEHMYGPCMELNVDGGFDDIEADLSS